MPSATRTSTQIELDGTYGEGGGALLRAALAMSALTQQPFHLTQVRGGTNHPGLDVEDALVVQAIASACGADVVGGSVGSQSLSFSPRRSLGPVILRQDGEVRGRGANGLVVLGSLLPIVARSGVYTELKVIGETYGNNTLTYDYFAHVTLGAARRMGLYAYPRLEVSGFGRENYGEVGLEVEPSALRGVEWLTRGALRRCHALVVTAQLPQTIGARAVSHLERLAHFSGLKMRVDALDVPGSSPGAVVTAWAEFDNGLGGVAVLGARGVRVETVAQGAFEAISTFLTSEATVDAYLADQVLLLGVLAEGRTAFTVPRLTQRLLTMIWVIKQFSPIHVTVSGTEGRPGSVTIEV
ncbi:MAG TPA: RNA 3'-terminal phosphate cyclase [Fimbriimonadaceae bacterium]|nr:RNA 3'-terminal phosphate cyclase [Fimbriimonadaceae bacterium]